jgi:hypothetical protein
MQRAFIIRPFGTKKDLAGRDIDFDHIQAVLIEPALKAVGLGGATTGEIIEAGNIREAMFGLILEGDIVVCDMTIHNAMSSTSSESVTPYARSALYLSGAHRWPMPFHSTT